MIYTVQPTATTMQRSIRFLSAAVLVAVLLIGASDALVAQQIPQYLSYQGVLTNQSREAVPDGSYSMTFRIYAQETGGAPIWEESQTVLTQDGVFDAYLGLQTPMALAFDAQYWVSSQVSGQPEMSPRTRLVPAPYAMTSSRALLADNVEGGFVKSVNGQQGDVTLVGGPGTTVSNNGAEITITAEGGNDLRVTEGAIITGDEGTSPIEVQIGQPGQVLNVNATGNRPEWTSDLTVSTINVRRIDVDSLFVNKYANFGGPTNFRDTVNFYGPVNFLFPTTNDLSYQSLVVGDQNNKMSELASTGTDGAILMQDAGGNPIWSTDLNVRNVNINGTQTTINSTTITVGPANSTTTFEGDVIFNKTPKIALAQNHIWAGDATGFQSPLAPGTTGSILMIDPNGAPRWNLNPGGLLPAGSTNGATLRWDGTKWVENTNLISDEFGNTQIKGILAVTGPEVYLPNGSVNNNELANSSININYGPGLTGGNSVQLGSTLTIENTGVVDVKGTPNQILANKAGTTVTLSAPQDIHTNAVPTFDGIILDNLQNGSTASEVLVSNNGTVETRTAASLFNEVTLSENALLIGDANDRPSELAAGSSGQTLRIDGAGAPTWQNVNELPDGTVTNATVVWNGTQWVENTNVTMNPTNGNTVIGGDLTVNKSFNGAGANKFAGAVTIPLSASNITVPYAGILAGAAVNISIRDDNPVVGIVPARVTSITPGVGFTVQLAINYDSPTGVLHYIVVNP